MIFVLLQFAPALQSRWISLHENFPNKICWNEVVDLFKNYLIRDTNFTLSTDLAVGSQETRPSQNEMDHMSFQPQNLRNGVPKFEILGTYNNL